VIRKRRSQVAAPFREFIIRARPPLGLIPPHFGGRFVPREASVVRYWSRRRHDGRRHRHRRKSRYWHASPDACGTSYVSWL
jgi:hypothetical protein